MYTQLENNYPCPWLGFALRPCFNLQIIYWLEMRNSNIFQLCLWTSTFFFSLPFHWKKSNYFLSLFFLIKPKKQFWATNIPSWKFFAKFIGIFSAFQVISGKSVTKIFTIAYNRLSFFQPPLISGAPITGTVQILHILVYCCYTDALLLGINFFINQLLLWWQIIPNLSNNKQSFIIHVTGFCWALLGSACIKRLLSLNQAWGVATIWKMLFWPWKAGRRGVSIMQVRLKLWPKCVICYICSHPIG